MVLKTVLPDLKRHLKHGSIFRCLPFRWDYKNGEIVQNRTQSAILFLQLGTVLHSLHLFFQVISLFRRDIGNVPVLRADQFVAGLIVVIYGGWFTLCLETEPDFAPMQILNHAIYAIYEVNSKVLHNESIIDNFFFHR